MTVPLEEKKVRFSENLSKVFPEVNNIFESDHQPKILEKEEITVSNVRSMNKELNEGKLPDQLKIFSVEEKEENLLKTHVRKKVGILSKGNKEFLEYFASKYGRDILQKNKLFKIKFLNLDINLTGDLEYYIRETLDGVTSDKYDIHINSTSKFLFYRFNNFR